MLNNNNQVINVNYAEESTDDEEVFNTSFVEASFVSADFFSKSLNDIRSDIIPQNGLRPNLVAFKSDDLFLSVSISVNVYSQCEVVIDSL